jgi:Rad3-related DNA helicase
VENRPLHDATQGFMTKEHRGETLPKIASAIVQLMDRHRDEKGLIHCHSYSIKQQLVDAVRKESTTPSRVMSHSSNDRDQMLESWKQKNGNEVFFSVKMEEALDLKYELCRWQAITKAPYKHTADPIVNHRLEENDEWAWYYRTALRTIIQACGRVVRQPDDYGDTYILDRSILDVFERARSDMPDWFKSQVRRMDEIDLTAQQSNPQF